jgi:hypothetical protein
LKLFENFAPAVPEKNLVPDYFKIPMNAICVSVRLRIFPNFFKKWRALPEVFYARRWPEVSRLCPSAVT